MIVLYTVAFAAVLVLGTAPLWALLYLLHLATVEETNCHDAD